MIKMTFEQLVALLKEAGDAAIQSYIRSTEPLADRINQADAKRWISALGYKPVMLRKWVDAGLLNKVKTDENKDNSQVWYSKAEIKRIIGASKIYSMT